MIRVTVGDGVWNRGGQDKKKVAFHYLTESQDEQTNDAIGGVSSILQTLYMTRKDCSFVSTVRAS